MQPVPPSPPRADPVTSGRRGRRWPYVVAMVLGLVIFLLAWIYWPVPVPPLRIAMDTTYLTGPLNPDGTVNYLAALNEIQSEGVTPENNAAIPLLQALGPGLIPDRKVLPTVLEQLGAKPLAQDGRYFVPFDAYVQRKQPGLLTVQDEDGTSPVPVADIEAIPEQVIDGSAPEHRVLVDGWLAENVAALELVVQAAQRPRFFMPLVSLQDPPRMMDGFCVDLKLLRMVGKALYVRASIRANDGDLDGAWHDSQALHRLGVLYGQQITAIGVLVGVALDAAASDADVRIAGRSDLSVARARSMLAELRALPELPSIYRAIDLGERCMMLDSIMQIMRSPAKLPGGTTLPVYRTGAVDFNLILHRTNAAMDANVAPLRVDDYSERRRLLAEQGDEFAERVQANSDLWSGGWGMLRLMAVTPGVRVRVKSELIGDLLLSFMMPSLGTVDRHRLAAVMHRRLAEASLALAVYQKERGSYPPSLDELVPEYLPRVPVDVFSGKPLVYKPHDAGYLLYSVGMNGEDNGGQEGEGRDLDDLAVRVGEAASQVVEAE